MSDKDIGLAFARGEEKAFTIVYNRLHKSLLWYALKLVKEQPDSKQLAEDIVQHVFVYIWNSSNREKQCHYKQLTDYLYTSVHNYALNTIRFKNKTTYNVPEVKEEPSLKFAENEKYSDMLTALNMLPEQCKRIFIMRYFGEMTVKEIEAKMKLENSTVKSQLARGMRLLRKWLGVSPEYIKKKEERWVKRIYFSISKTGSIVKTHGITQCHVWDIKNGKAHKNITKDL